MKDSLNSDLHMRSGTPKGSLNCDLHMHSKMSDGTDTPAELAIKCAQHGIVFAALTDHDTAAGVTAFACEGLMTITGIEWNVEYTGEELHILGYGFDPAHTAFKAITRELMTNREERAIEMTHRLRQNGFDVCIEEVREKARGIVIGRPHIADVLIEKGYARDMEDAFKNFLTKGKPGYHPRKKLSSKRAIDVTRVAGGVCVMAHPGISADPDLASLLKRLTDEGLWGIEIYYPTHSDEEVAHYERLAREFSLFATRGSDYHGEGRKGVVLGQEKRRSELLERGVEVLMGMRGQS